MVAPSKVCAKCQTEKSLDEFSRDRGRRDGRFPWCKACKRGDDRAYREVNRDKISERDRSYREANKEKITAQQRSYREANKEKISQTDRAYREANKEKISLSKKRYREENAERVAEHKRRYREGNREEILRREKAWREAHKDELAERDRIFREANPHVYWRSSYRFRAKEAGFEPVVEEFTKADVIRLYGDACVYCDGGAFEHLDHYVPVSQGGPHTLENVRPSCAFCNMSKNSRAMGKDSVEHVSPQ